MSANQLPENEPESSWSLDQLKPEIVDQHNLMESFSRKTAVHTYRLGKLLTLAKSKVPYGTWAVFLQQIGISIATDNRARDLYDSIDAEIEIEGLTITEAYEKAGISIGKKTKPESVTPQSKDDPTETLRLKTEQAEPSGDEDETHGDAEINAVPQTSDEGDGGVPDDIDEDNSDSDDDDDDGQFDASDSMILSLNVIATELESFADDAVSQIDQDKRDDVRMAIQKVGTAHQRLLDAFFTAVEAA